MRRQWGFADAASAPEGSLSSPPLARALALRGWGACLRDMVGSSSGAYVLYLAEHSGELPAYSQLSVDPQLLSSPHSPLATPTTMSSLCLVGCSSTASELRTHHTPFFIKGPRVADVRLFKDIARHSEALIALTSSCTDAQDLAYIREVILTYARYKLRPKSRGNKDLMHASRKLNMLESVSSWSLSRERPRQLTCSAPVLPRP